jgi:DNA/RNA endonuclease YhcR with UshA esterase domain
MRWSMPAIVSLFLLVPLAMAHDEPQPLGPVEAAKKVNEEVTVRMEVKSANLRSSICFLNSEEDFKNANNLTLFIDKDALAKFKEAKIDDPAAFFKGKTVEVKGKVTLYREHPEIKLAGPDAIKIIEKK